MNIPDLNWFESRKSDSFDIKFEGDSAVSCQIAEITVSNAPSTQAGKKQFSVIFSKPEAIVYEQGIYQVSHPDMEETPVFLVPVFGDEKGVHYEAVFT